MEGRVGTSFQLVPGKSREPKYVPGITWVIVSARLIVANDSSFEVNGGDLVHEIVAKKLCKDKTFNNWMRYERFAGGRRLSLKLMDNRFKEIPDFRALRNLLKE